MSHINTLEDEVLVTVSGGSGTFGGVTYNDGDIFVKNMNDIFQENFDIYVLKNCAGEYCDCDVYSYSNIQKKATFSHSEWTFDSYWRVYQKLYKLNDLEINEWC